MTALCVGALLWLNGCVLDPTPTDYPLLLTWYNPRLGGVNCDADCSTYADGTSVSERDFFGLEGATAAACPPELLGALLVLPRLSGRGDWFVKCRDTGPSIRVRWNDYHARMVTHLDVLAHDGIPCNYCLIQTWGVVGWPEG